MNLRDMIKKLFISPRLEKRDFDPKKVSIEDIKLPKGIKSFGSNIITSTIKDEVSTYKSLGYYAKGIETLECNVYHSLQIGIMLKYIQLDMYLFIAKPSDIFPKKILLATKETLQSRVFDIFKKYDNSVKKNLTQTQLLQDIEWTPLEAGYLLYYLSIYKN
jgi:hypothetical protein